MHYRGGHVIALAGWLELGLACLHRSTAHTWCEAQETDGNELAADRCG